MEKCLIFCHGMYCTPESLKSLQRQAKGIKCIFPKAPTRTISWPNGRERDVISWYNYYSDNRGKPDVIEERNFNSQVRRIQQIVRREVKRFGKKNVFVGGVSQGGTVAGAVATIEGIGLILSRSCFIFTDIMKDYKKDAKFPILVTSGYDDQVYPVPFQKKSLKCFPHAHWKLFPNIDHHKYSSDEIKYIVKWICGHII